MYQGKERTRKEMKAKGMKGKEMNIYIYMNTYKKLPALCTTPLLVTVTTQHCPYQLVNW